VVTVAVDTHLLQAALLLFLAILLLQVAMDLRMELPLLPLQDLPVATALILLRLQDTAAILPLVDLLEVDMAALEDLPLVPIPNCGIGSLL
jgi:hypothetical protein